MARVPCAEAIGNYLGDDFDEVITRIPAKYSIEEYNVEARPAYEVKSLFYNKKANTNKFHRDGKYTSSGMISPYAIIVWSNKQPTEIIDEETKEKLKFKWGDIIYIRNKRALHRTPLKISKGRLFFRAWDVKQIKGL